MSLALIKLIKEGDIDGVKRMLDYRTKKIHIREEYTAILLIHALESESPNRKDIFEYIVNYTGYNMSDRDDDQEGATLLMKMIKGGCSINSISLLLKYMKPEEIETKNYDNYTALFIAVSEYSKILIYTEPDEIVLINYRDVIVELLKHGANPLTEYYRETMRFIIETNMFDLLKMCVDQCKYDIKNEMLRISMICNNYDFVEYLIGKIKDINKLNIGRKTLLEYAQDLNPPNEDMVELLRVSDPNPGADK